MNTCDTTNVDKVKIGGLIVTLGIVYGDLGTSPLYTMQAIMLTGNKIDKMFILGALSCIFWTIMLESTLKYVFITLKASNKGEGGIFSLFTMVRDKVKWAFIIAIIGACALLADGVITPAITVTSSMEGLQIFDSSLPVVGLVIIILTGIFLIQPFGTKRIGTMFGPVMLIWFAMLLILGLVQLVKSPEVLKAINPYYAIYTIMHNPEVLKLLGAVFLCTTGAEALYSDLGHVGIKNIRMTWILVSTSLLLNYFGQGAWILSQSHYSPATENPFFSIMPGWFLFIGVIIATFAAIIASQALISGSYTIISEAISLNFFPKLRIDYPTSIKRQMYIPKVNWFLYFCALFVVVYFRNSTAMESAYGLSISFAMICTSILLVIYLWNKIPKWATFGYILIFGIIEIGFLTANMTKFFSGGWVTVMLGALYVSIMYSWSKGGEMAKNFIIFKDIRRFIPVLKAMQADDSLPVYSSNLVYITDSEEPIKIENSILYSILRKPKKSNIYWFIHTSTVNDPHTLTYQLFEIEPGLAYRINMNFGFKQQRKVNLYFNEILDDMIKDKKYTIISPHPSLKNNNILSDFKFIVIDNIQNKDYSFSMKKQLLMDFYYICKKYLVREINYLGLDKTITQTENIPLMTSMVISASNNNENEILKEDSNLNIGISETETIKPI